jgi:hypothetical protein
MGMKGGDTALLPQGPEPYRPVAAPGKALGSVSVKHQGLRQITVSVGVPGTRAYRPVAAPGKALGTVSVEHQGLRQIIVSVGVPGTTTVPSVAVPLVGVPHH